jgi:hypothetical protein
MSRALKHWKQNLDSLNEFLPYLATLKGILASLLCILPLAGFFVETLFPPKGHPLFILLAVAISLLGFLLLFTVCHSRTVRCVDLLAIILTCLGATLLLVYVVIAHQYLYHSDSGTALIGFAYTDEAHHAIISGHTSETTPSLLAHFGYAADEQIWRFRGLVFFIMLFLFVCSFTFVSGGVFLFAMKDYVSAKSRTVSRCPHCGKFLAGNVAT